MLEAGAEAEGMEQRGPDGEGVEEGVVELVRRWSTVREVPSPAA